MATLSELLNELRSLPKGNVYPKTINGSSYFYHQYFSNGKRYSRLLKRDEVDPLIAAISRRKELEELIKARQKEAKSATISAKANELSGFLMSGNRAVAYFDHGELMDMDEARVPLVIKRTHSMEEFLKLRVIDMSRTNARILKRVLNIYADEDYKVSLFSYGLSISDDYWFKPKHSKITYQKARFNNDNYFETALKGQAEFVTKRALITPEVTTTGSFEKGWHLIDDEWWLYKSGNARQLFSEMYSYEIARLLGIPNVEYAFDGAYIRSKNFAPDVNFEPLASLAGQDDRYEHVFPIMLELGKEFALSYLRLAAFDALIGNIDRHNENLGFLRNREEGKILSLAPNYDNNLALLGFNEYIQEDIGKDGLAKLFFAFLRKNEEATSLSREIAFPELSLEAFKSALKRVPMEAPTPLDLPQILWRRYLGLLARLNNKHN